MNEVRKCLICRKNTKGSVSKTGVVWKSLCQSCKDEEDNIALNVIKNMSFLKLRREK